MASHIQNESFLKQNLGVLSIIAWFGILVLQAFLSPLHIDEAYYRLYGQALDWGYFDHPPGIAIATALSERILPLGNLSVRFIPILLHIFSLVIGWNTFKRISPNNTSFRFPVLVLVLFLPMLHVYSFIATPDVVLFFTAILFCNAFVMVKKDGKLWMWIWWGISMALLMYSKYHGILIIGFSILSDIKLIRRPKFYLAIIVALITFIPHIFWQYEHDWASINFHLFERHTQVDWYSPFLYLGMLVIVFNPLLLWKYGRQLVSKAGDSWDRMMLFVFWGIVGFFLLQSFRADVQAQWILLAYIPFMYFIMKSFTGDGTDKTNFNFVYLAANLTIVIFIHLCLTFNLLPTNLGMFGQKEYAEQIKADSKGLPVVFYNSYKRASIYSWYTKEYAHSYNTAYSRKNQFNIWYRDSVMYDEDVYFVGMHFESEPAIKYGTSDYGVVKKYAPSDKIKVHLIDVELKGDSIKASVEIENPYKVSLQYPQSYHLAIYYFSDFLNDAERQSFSYQPFKVDANSVLIKELIWVKPKNLDNKISFGIATSHNDWPDGPIMRRHSLNNGQ